MTITAALKGARLVTIVLVLIGCDSAPDDSADDDQAPADPGLGLMQQELKSASSQGTPAQNFFGVENGSKNIESATAVIPPGVNASCSAGRVFVTLGGWVQWMDLDCLDNPGGTAGCHLDGAKSGQFSTGSLVSAAFPQTVPTFANAATQTCTTASTAPMYTQGGRDSAITRNGSNGENLLMMFAGDRWMTRYSQTTVCESKSQSRCAPERANTINFVARSTNCGATWTTTKAIDNGNGSGSPSATAPNPGGQGRWCGNLDFFLTQRSPYKPSTDPKYIYGFGFTGISCCGGVNGYTVYRSADNGATFVNKAILNNDIGPFSVAFWDDGTIALFGCGDDGRPRATWSWNSDDVTWTEVVGAMSMPACQKLQGNQMPADYYTFGPTNFSSISRITDPSLDPAFNYARIVYSTIEGQSTRLVRGLLKVPRNGASVTPSIVHYDVMPGRSAANSLFRASFATDTFAASDPDTALLFWQEGSPSNDTYSTRYSVVSGLRNYTPPRDLSVTTGGGTRSWTPNFVADATGRWAGEFDRPSLYRTAAESTVATDVAHAFTQWTESHTAADTGYIHYSDVDITRPLFGAFSRVSNALALKAQLSVGAATVVPSSPAGEKLIQVYAVDTQNRVQRIVYSTLNGTWSGWTNTQGISAHGVAATSWGTGRVDVFAVGQDGNMWHFAEQGGVTQTCCPWEPLGGPTGGFIGAPSAASQAANQLFVVGIGTGGALHYRTYKSGWSSWQPLAGGIGTTAPAAVSWGPGRLDVFARGQNAHLWHYWATDNGSATWEGNGTWQDLGGAPLTSISATSQASGRLDTFALDADSQIQHLWYQSGWSDWHTIGGVTGEGPGAVATGSNRVAVFARGTDGFLWWSRRGF